MSGEKGNHGRISRTSGVEAPVCISIASKCLEPSNGGLCPVFDTLSLVSDFNENGIRQQKTTKHRLTCGKYCKICKDLKRCSWV
ncbi:hypothetical protein ELI54_14925 [Rhizobium ruizarguesonis]|nr:hypothetical protein ELI56_04440 [Rhizobium ruizarguesonis]TBY49270.1 hypothetical protein E0H59_28550 [Rhizobium leguminosarum bv. viciae]TAT89401.1 hypothetical protein ELI54_14925 [Rhizobium ruizarguesonis]TAU04204.1 hypothetical protein ELI55_04525 [Rhizobium ruizarguesonis]TAU67121.1 hypothetical protein ELI45_04195 [Rhizobium ruizarguesonis]